MFRLAQIKHNNLFRYQSMQQIRNPGDFMRACFLFDNRWMVCWCDNDEVLSVWFELFINVDDSLVTGGALCTALPTAHTDIRSINVP